MNWNYYIKISKKNKFFLKPLISKFEGGLRALYPRVTSLFSIEKIHLSILPHALPRAPSPYTIKTLLGKM
ncbi:hypothetical protein [Peptoniphilus asaccharolyticus]